MLKLFVCLVKFAVVRVVSQQMRIFHITIHTKNGYQCKLNEISKKKRKKNAHLSYTVNFMFCVFFFSAKRAAYRWSRDRAKIASRWTWLLAQISDLEYRIRQHQELYILLKKSNGKQTTTIL